MGDVEGGELDACRNLRKLLAALDNFASKPPAPHVQAA